MTHHTKPSVFAPNFEESPLFSFSSRSNSPTAIHKLSTIPFEFTETTRPGSFLSYQTPQTRFSSMSATHEHFPKLSDESLAKIHTKISKIQEEYDKKSPTPPLALRIPTTCIEESELESGIPTLRWCAYCKAETATEIFYENSTKTFLSSLAIFISGGILGCCMLPYAMNSCKDIRSRCHRCKHQVGRNGSCH